jgi:hypothetical protein
MRFRVGARLLVAVALPALAACKATPKERLEGRWVGERADNFNPAQADRAAGWVTGASFEFKGSRVTVSIPAESPREGTFKITRASEQELEMTFLRPQGAEDQVTFQLEGEDRMRWMLGDGRSIVLRKVMD